MRYKDEENLVTDGFMVGSVSYTESQPVWAAITKYHRAGNLQTMEIYFGINDAIVCLLGQAKHVEIISNVFLLYFCVSYM